MMERFSIQLKTLTPLFMSGVDGRQFEWRSFSVKGMLRWWFRAAGGRRETEGWLFGQTLQKPMVASGVRLRVAPVKISEQMSGYFENKNLIPAYFAFPFRLKGGPRRGIEPGGMLNLELIFQSRLTGLDRQKVLSALWLAVHLGTFGCRARKGFGSLLPVETTKAVFPWFSGDVILQDPDDFARVLNEQIERLRERPPRILYTFLVRNTWRELAAFYKETRRNLRSPYKELLGYPIFKQTATLGKVDRFASPLWLKPIGPNTALLTILNIPSRMRREARALRSDDTHPEVTFARHIKNYFLKKLEIIKILYRPQKVRSKRMDTRLWIMIEPMDVTLFRDGRPFTAGETSFAQSLFPPNPSRIAGALRTFIGRKALGGHFSGLGDAEKAPFQFIGPVPMRTSSTALFPWPADLVRSANEGVNRHVIRRRLRQFPAYLRRHPIFSEYGLVFIDSEDSSAEEGEIVQLRDRRGNPWITADGLAAWSRGLPRYRLRVEAIDFVDVESRPGIRTVPDTATIDPEGGAFYFVQMNRHEDGTGFLVGLQKHQCGDDVWTKIIRLFEDSTAQLIHLGGERRLARIYRVVPEPTWFKESEEPLYGVVRLMLLTPARIALGDGGRTVKIHHGSEQIEGTLLAMAVAGSPRVMTGWDYQSQSPKAHRRLIPAGSVLVVKIPERPTVSKFGWVGEHTSLGYGWFYACHEPDTDALKNQEG